jgi:hypothetical protein
MMALVLRGRGVFAGVLFMVPEDIFPDLLRTKCVKAIQCLRSVQPQIAERIVSVEDAKKLLKEHRLELTGTIKRTLYSMADLKEKLVIEDIKTLFDRLNKHYIEKLEQSGVDLTCHQDLCQVVEIDLTFQDLYPGDQMLHYKIFTKRDIFLESELFEKTGIQIIRDPDELDDIETVDW